MEEGVFGHGKILSETIRRGELIEEKTIRNKWWYGNKLAFGGGAWGGEYIGKLVLVELVKGLAEAWRGKVDYLVSLVHEYVFAVTGLAEPLPFPMGTPGDFLDWPRAG